MRTTGPDPHSFRDLATPRGSLNQGSELSIRTTDSNLARSASGLGWIYPIRDGPGRNLCRARFRRCRRGTVGSNATIVTVAKLAAARQLIYASEKEMLCPTKI
jgi:hypothetical protein